jgi:hypothetical protein
LNLHRDHRHPRRREAPPGKRPTAEEAARFIVSTSFAEHVLRPDNLGMFAFLIPCSLFSERPSSR